MFFCGKCRYLYNVTKDVKSKQIGGKINAALTNIFNKYYNKEALEDIDLKKVTGKDLTDDDRFENMTKKEQRKMISYVKALDKTFFIEKDTEDKLGGTNAFFICKYCGHSKPIKPGTLIYSKNYIATGNTEVNDYSGVIDDPTLPRTRDYICKNNDCNSHKNNIIKEATLTKNANEQIVYICNICFTSWVNTV